MILMPTTPLSQSRFGFGIFLGELIKAFTSNYGFNLPHLFLSHYNTIQRKHFPIE